MPDWLKREWRTLAQQAVAEGRMVDLVCAPVAPRADARDEDTRDEDDDSETPSEDDDEPAEEIPGFDDDDIPF
jgi:hypothetical protein